MLTETLAYPVVITLKNAVIVFITIFILGTIASKIASSRINKSLIKIA
jgi:lipoprotein-releasing system permease protein